MATFGEIVLWFVVGSYKEEILTTDVFKVYCLMNLSISLCTAIISKGFLPPLSCLSLIPIPISLGGAGSLQLSAAFPPPPSPASIPHCQVWRS